MQYNITYKTSLFIMNLVLNLNCILQLFIHLFIYIILIEAKKKEVYNITQVNGMVTLLLS